MKRYTIDEIHDMLNEAEANYVAGHGIPDEEAWDDLDVEFADMDKELYTPEEAYELTMKDIKAIYGDATV